MPEKQSLDGEQILGYRLIERLGAGGFGEVWKAAAPGGLLKALKIVYGRLGERHANQEVRALDRIKEVRHPFILSLERIEVVDGRLIMVSELADKTLLDRFEECRADGGHGIPRSELLRYMHDAAEAIDFITSRFRLQHLDIKPSNLFLVGGRLKIGDFGLVREVCEGSSTAMGGLSPAYASPETFTGELSLYADQYGLAIVYQEMLTGIRPFRGRTSLQLSEQHLHAPPNLSPLLPEEQPIIGRALAKDSKARFPTCGGMVQALASINVVESPPDALVNRLDGESMASSLVSGPDSSWRSIGVTDSPLESDQQTNLQAGEPSPAWNGHAPVRSSRTADSSGERLPEPTLFVGIGGVAGCVLRQIKSLFQTRSGHVGEKCRLGWLLVDTDPASLEESRRPGTAGKLGAEETVHVPLHGPEHYRPQLKQWLAWIDRHWLFSIPRTHLTEGIRPLGRLALLDNAGAVLRCLRESIRRVNSKILDDEVRRRFEIVVIAGITGGTGGGCLADVGLAIRQILVEENLADIPVSCVVIIASSVRRDRKELACANAHVTLLELCHYQGLAGRFPGVAALGVGPSEEGVKLFDEITVADFGEIVVDDDLENSAQLLAERIYLQRGTEFGRALKNRTCPNRGPRVGIGLTRFRMIRQGFPRAELLRLVAREVCKRLINRWLTSRPRKVNQDEPARSQASLMAAAGMPESAVADPDEVFAQMELEECRFQETFLERVERVGGSGPLSACLRKLGEPPRSRGRKDGKHVLRECLDELDERLGQGSPRPPGQPISSAIAQKLHNEFKHDTYRLEQKLEAWVKGIVDQPSQRLNVAIELLGRFTQKLVEQIDLAPSRLKEIQDKKQRLRDRNTATTASAWTRMANLIRPVDPQTTSLSAELVEYGQLCMRQTAIEVQAEIFSALLGKTSRIGEELRRWQLRLTDLKKLFEAVEPAFQKSERATLGYSIDLVPVDTIGLADLRDELAGAFLSERRLARLEQSFQDEVLDAYEGLTGVLSREPGFAAELFGTTLFQRVCLAVGHWQEGQDAASILHKRYGSMDAVVSELVRSWKTATFSFPDGGAQRLVAGVPGSPSGRSLRESLMKSADALSIAEFVTIPDDVVLCLEAENISFASVSAELVEGQPWLAQLATRLVSRIDMDWAGLAGTRPMVRAITREDDV